MSKIIKKSVPLLGDSYQSPNTSTLIFQFGSEYFSEVVTRLRNSKIQHLQIEGKDLYIIDDFFHDLESNEMRLFSETASFSRNSYGSTDAIERGEKPARSMNGKERWQFFAKPPNAIHEIYKLFSGLAEALSGEITTLPWELCEKNSSSGSPAVIANKLEEASRESQELGKHQDCNPEGKISFGIPILYSEKEEVYPPQFINGEKGKPFLVSLMLYVTAPEFLPERGLGTVFYDSQGKIVFKTECKNMRLVLFQGDIFHSIEESLPNAWRISYVYKLMINPKSADDNMKEKLLNWMKRSAVQGAPI